ncbi:hypothetical protein ACFH5T_24475, partial [Escherichia coli]
PVSQAGFISQIREIREMRTYMFLRRWLRNMCGLRRENPSGRWLRSLREHNHLSQFFFDRCVGNKKIGTPEGAPTIFRLPMVKFSPFARLKGGCYLEISQLAVRSL